MTTVGNYCKEQVIIRKLIEKYQRNFKTDSTLQQQRHKNYRKLIRIKSQIQYRNQTKVWKKLVVGSRSIVIASDSHLAIWTNWIYCYLHAHIEQCLDICTSHLKASSDVRKHKMNNEIYSSFSYLGVFQTID